MALFGKKKSPPKEEEIKKNEKKPKALSKAVAFVMEPHIAEKATNLSEKGVYVFRIAKEVNKIMMRQAIKEKYRVVPQKVNIVNLPKKTIVFRGKKGVKSGIKKAVVYLKQGDKIEIS